MAYRISDLVASVAPAGTDQLEMSKAGAAGSRSLTLALLRTALFAGSTGFTAVDPINVGSITITQGTIAALAQGITQTVTWNNAAVSFVAQDLNVTDTASSAASILARWRVGGAAQFTVFKSGLVQSAGTINAGANLSCASAGVVVFGVRSTIRSSADGQVNVTNNAGTSFTRLTLGPETALFPSLKVNGANLQVRLGDDSGFTGLAAGSIGIGQAVSATSPLSIIGLPSSSAGLSTGDAYLAAGALMIK